MQGLPILPSSSWSTKHERINELRVKLAELQAARRKLAPCCSVVETPHMVPVPAIVEDVRPQYVSFCVKGSALERRLAAIFAAIDANHDGFIEIGEMTALDATLGDVFRKMDSIETDGAVTPDEWHQFFAQLHASGGQSLVELALSSFEALLCDPAPRQLVVAEDPRPVAVETCEPSVGQRIDAVFRGLDLDGNGAVDRQELADIIVENTAVLAPLSQLLDSIHVDGLVSADEFRAFFATLQTSLGDLGRDTVLATFETLLRLRAVARGAPLPVLPSRSSPEDRRHALPPMSLASSSPHSFVGDERRAAPSLPTPTKGLATLAWQSSSSLVDDDRSRLSLVTPTRSPSSRQPTTAPSLAKCLSRRQEASSGVFPTPLPTPGLPGLAAGSGATRAVSPQAPPLK